MYDTIGERIMKIRLDKRMNQKDFAEAIGISGSNLSKLERDIFTPSRRTLMMLYRRFGINPIWLETGKGEEYIKNIEEDESDLTEAAEESKPENLEEEKPEEEKPEKEKKEHKRESLFDDNTIVQITKALAGQNEAKKRLVLFVANMPDSLIYAFCEYLEKQKGNEAE